MHSLSPDRIDAPTPVDAPAPGIGTMAAILRPELEGVRT